MRTFSGPLTGPEHLLLVGGGFHFEVVEAGDSALAEGALADRDGDAEFRGLGVLEREGVEQAEQAVADDQVVDLLAEILPGAQRRVDAGVRLALDVKRHTYAVNVRDQGSVEEVVDGRAGGIAGEADRDPVRDARRYRHLPDDLCVHLLATDVVGRGGVAGVARDVAGQPLDERECGAVTYSTGCIPVMVD